MEAPRPSPSLSCFAVRCPMARAGRSSSEPEGGGDAAGVGIVGGEGGIPRLEGTRRGARGAGRAGDQGLELVNLMEGFDPDDDGRDQQQEAHGAAGHHRDILDRRLMAGRGEVAQSENSERCDRQPGSAERVRRRNKAQVLTISSSPDTPCA